MNPAHPVQMDRLHAAADFQACFDLQMSIWRYAAGEAMPTRMFLMAEKLGGQVLGARVDGRIVGFTLGLAAVRDRGPYLHSQMLAVAPEYRDSGIGRALKLRQRELALEQGYERIEWTFDPLEVKNAYFNIAVLGAIARRYVPDFYGASTSPLQAGLPTDRLYAEWNLRSDRVQIAVSANAQSAQQHVARVQVPGSVYRMKADAGERDTLLAIQAQVRERLQDAFASGLAATGYERLPDGGGCYFLSAVSETEQGVNR